MGRRVGAMWLAVGCLVAGCSAPTELLVLVESDLSVPDDLDRVEVEVSGMGREPRSSFALLDADNRLPQQLLVRYSGDGRSARIR